MSNITHKSATVSRLLLGLIFFVFGLNGFLGFIPQPPMPDAAAAFVGGLASSGYFFPLLKGTEVLAGIALLSNRYVPLALAVLAPISINIFLFHLVLAPGVGLSVVIIATQAFLAWVHKDAYAKLLTAKSELPAVTAHVASGAPSHA